MIVSRTRGDHQKNANQHVTNNAWTGKRETHTDIVSTFYGLASLKLSSTDSSSETLVVLPWGPIENETPKGY